MVPIILFYAKCISCFIQLSPQLVGHSFDLSYNNTYVIFVFRKSLKPSVNAGGFIRIELMQDTI